MPAAREFERIRFESREITVLTCVDLNFEAQLRFWGRFRREAEDQMHRMAGGLACAVSEPRERFTRGVDCWTNPLGPDLHQVDVLGVAQRLPEQQLINCSTAAKSEPAFQF